ncbi:MAG: hypothetical protein H6975_07695 [Gammaproteobacteria bacterium]|nr:hypothetical protein [Gammaproteobacteria bacterium]
MLHPNLATTDRQQTQAALEAMRNYFAATAQAQPRKERQRLAQEWLTAVRQMRTRSITQSETETL